MPVVSDFFVVMGAQSQVASGGASASASATASGGIAKNNLLPLEGAVAGRSGLLGGGWAAMIAGALGLAVLQVESWLLKLLKGWRVWGWRWEDLLALRPSRFPSSLRSTFCTSALARRRIVSKLVRLEVVIAILYKGATKTINMKYISGSA